MSWLGPTELRMVARGRYQAALQTAAADLAIDVRRTVARPGKCYDDNGDLIQHIVGDVDEYYTVGNLATLCGDIRVLQNPDKQQGDLGGFRVKVQDNGKPGSVPADRFDYSLTDECSAHTKINDKQLIAGNLIVREDVPD